MKRCEFITAIAGALAMPSRVLGQGSARVPTIGILGFSPVPTPAQIAAAPTTAAMVEMGWIEGRTINYERRSHAGRNERVAEIAAELVERRVDLILAVGPLAAVAAARATRTIPVVFGFVNGPVGLGLADSLVRPGRNATGTQGVPSNEFWAKPLQLLHEIKPELKQVAALTEQTSALMNVAGEMVEPRTAENVADRSAFVARHTGINLRDYPIGNAVELDAALANIVQTAPHGLYVGPSVVLFQNRRRIADVARRQGLPSVSIDSNFAEAGGLLSYGVDNLATIKQTLRQVDRVLRGAKPADMPIELPTRFELIINLETARELGLKIPASVLARADRTIES